MSCSLTLEPDTGQAFTVRLKPGDKRSRMEPVIARMSDACVFSDRSYEFVLSGEELAAMQSVTVYINDVVEQTVLREGRILFPGRDDGARLLFADCYGFVEITLAITFVDGEIVSYSAGCLPVLVRPGGFNNSVQSMVSYVYAHQELLRPQGSTDSDLASLAPAGNEPLAAQLLLAEEIAAVYESSFGYFKTNSRYKIDKVSKIDQFEHIQYVTPAMIQFITSHPEELRQVSSYPGIRIGNHIYQPEKTLSIQNECSFNIYENQVILGFIRKMAASIDELYEHCQSLLEQTPGNEQYGDEYIYSSFFIFHESHKKLEQGLKRIQSLRHKFTRLWVMYSNIFKIRPEIMTSEPRPSHIFLSVPQYHRIFVQIHKWFQNGVYDFSRESFMLSFIKISSLYEFYVLAKMVAYFKSRDYVLTITRKYVYPNLYKWKWKYQNTRGVNIFCFSRDKYRITLYYQPVIYDTDKDFAGGSGIGLLRNNTIPVFNSDEDGPWSGGHYYSPDYIIKIEMEGKTSASYLILDAKFSDHANVRKYYVRDLAFKYLFSVSPIQPGDQVAGMCILYGKGKPLDRMKSAYDCQLPKQQITPVAELLPLIESISHNMDDRHYHNFDVLISRVQQTLADTTQISAPVIGEAEDRVAAPVAAL